MVELGTWAANCRLRWVERGIGVGLFSPWVFHRVRRVHRWNRWRLWLCRWDGMGGLLGGAKREIG